MTAYQINFSTSERVMMPTIIPFLETSTASDDDSNEVTTSTRGVLVDDGEGG